MAAVTKTLRFYPAVMKLPVRQPLVLAKALSSLAVISGNRVSLGAGLGPWREDFTYNGVAFEKRGKLMDECIEIIRGALRRSERTLPSLEIDRNGSMRSTART